MDSRRRRSLLLLLVIYPGFVSLGLPDGMLGVAWPAIYPELGLPLGLAGTILTISTVLTGIAGFSSGWIISRLGTGPVVLASGLLTAAGMCLFSQAGGAAGLYLAAVPLGIGAGAVDAGLNGYVARHYSGRQMNWLHACWGIGATCGPFVLGLALGGGHGWRAGYLWTGGLQFLLAAVFLLTLGLWEKDDGRRAEDGDVEDIPEPAATANSVAGWLSAGIFALYVAAEFTIGLWAGTVLVARQGFSPEHAAWCTAAFFGALTAGRIVAGLVVDRWGNRRMVATGAWVAVAGLAGFIFSTGAVGAALALAVTGLGLAPVYPAMMHEVPRRFAPEAVQTVIGRQSGGAAFGAAVLPALAGGVAQHSLAAVPWIALAVLLVMMAGIRILNRMT